MGGILVPKKHLILDLVMKYMNIILSKYLLLSAKVLSPLF